MGMHTHLKGWVGQRWPTVHNEENPECFLLGQHDRWVYCSVAAPIKDCINNIHRDCKRRRRQSVRSQALLIVPSGMSPEPCTGPPGPDLWRRPLPPVVEYFVAISHLKNLLLDRLYLQTPSLCSYRDQRRACMCRLQIIDTKNFRDVRPIYVLVDIRNECIIITRVVCFYLGDVDEMTLRGSLQPSLLWKKFLGRLTWRKPSG